MVEVEKQPVVMTGTRQARLEVEQEMLTRYKDRITKLME